MGGNVARGDVLSAESGWQPPEWVVNVARGDPHSSEWVAERPTRELCDCQREQNLMIENAVPVRGIECVY